MTPSFIPQPHQSGICMLLVSQHKTARNIRSQCCHLQHLHITAGQSLLHQLAQPLTVTAAALPAATVPYPPKMTLSRLLFMALHIM